MLQNYHTEFLTATIFSWHQLLKDDEFKKIITDSFQWLVNGKKCIINAFVIMANHIHLIWKISDGFERKDVQGALFNFTADEFKRKSKEIIRRFWKTILLIMRTENISFGNGSL